MNRSKVARIKDGTARFKYLMCPFCVAICDNDEAQQNDYGIVTVQCPNCSREFTVYIADLQNWQQLELAV